MNLTKSLYAISFLGALFLGSVSQVHAETLAPPTLGEQTKGRPAIVEPSPVDPKKTQEKVEEPTNDALSALGHAKVTEHKRENGQVYLIELEHSLGAKQYLYENDSDGQIGSTIEQDESLSEIPKWKLGAW